MITVSALMRLTSLTRYEIFKRCEILQIVPTIKDKSILTLEDVGRICHFDEIYMPKIIYKTENYFFFESKMNNENK